MTRILRTGVELVARPNLILQMGDNILVVGPEEGIERVAALVGNKPEALSHPNLVPIFFGIALIATGTLCFTLMPGTMLRVFTADSAVVDIGCIAFPFIGISFIGMVTSLIFPVFFQAVGSGFISSLLTVVRTVVLFVPLGYAFSRFGLEWFWLTFPVTEGLTSLLGYCLYRRFFLHPCAG